MANFFLQRIEKAQYDLDEAADSIISAMDHLSRYNLDTDDLEDLLSDIKFIKLALDGVEPESEDEYGD